MRFLLDQGISPTVTDALRELGHDAIHVRDIGLAAAPDLSIVAVAAAEERTIITVDLDFAAIVASSGNTRPSVVTLRLGNTNPAGMRAAALGAAAADWSRACSYPSHRVA